VTNPDNSQRTYDLPTDPGINKLSNPDFHKVGRKNKPRRFDFAGVFSVQRPASSIHYPYIHQSVSTR
jgi:hypothetical protein